LEVGDQSADALRRLACPTSTGPAGNGHDRQRWLAVLGNTGQNEGCGSLGRAVVLETAAHRARLRIAAYIFCQVGWGDDAWTLAVFIIKPAEIDVLATGRKRFGKVRSAVE
jgi:hypothetical protein